MPILYRHAQKQRHPLYWAPMYRTAARKLCKNFMSAVVAQNTVDLNSELLRQLPLCPFLPCPGSANPRATKEDKHTCIYENIRETYGFSKLAENASQALMCASTRLRKPVAKILVAAVRVPCRCWAKQATRRLSKTTKADKKCFA